MSVSMNGGPFLQHWIISLHFHKSVAIPNPSKFSQLASIPSGRDECSEERSACAPAPMHGIHSTGPDLVFPRKISFRFRSTPTEAIVIRQLSS